MKAIAKKLTVYGNLGFVQFITEPQSKTLFNPGAPEIRSGKLIIIESTGSGIVGQLTAINNTSEFLLLTDADILIGAKQNRVLNSSVLLAPYSKTPLEVSCIERLRWHYVSEKFSTPDVLADLEMRKHKVSSFKPGEVKGEVSDINIQSNVWSFVQENLRECNCSSKTESYADLITHRRKIVEKARPQFEPESSCNSLAVIIDREVVSVDIYGREDVYRYYFPLLGDSAFQSGRIDKKAASVDEAEAFFKVLQLLDDSELIVKHTRNEYPASGEFRIFENEKLIGQELTINGEMVHTAIFGR